MKKYFLAISIISCITGALFAKGNAVDNKLGVGFNQQLSSYGVNSVSMRYWDSDKLGFEGILGFYNDDNNSYFDLGGKVLVTIRKESNLKLYGMGMLGMESYTRYKGSRSEDSDTNLIIAAGLGVEFFFSEMPNLGFGTELGLGYNSGPKAFGTFAGWIPSVGIRYYF